MSDTHRTGGIDVLEREEAKRVENPPESPGHIEERTRRTGSSKDASKQHVVSKPTSMPFPHKRRLTSPAFMVAYFAALNVVMYVLLQRFWIGGSSFLPLLGKVGPGNKFLFALLVNVGVILGAFLGAYTSGEFRLRYPRRRDWLRAIVGGCMIGIGVSLAPGTCTTAFVTGVPMLSVSSFMSIAGIIIGSHLVYRYTLGRR